MRSGDSMGSSGHNDVGSGGPGSGGTRASVDTMGSSDASGSGDPNRKPSDTPAL